MGVNNQDQICVGTMAGEVAFTDSVKGFWHKDHVYQSSDFSESFLSIQNVCYFNADTAFVWGAIFNNIKYNVNNQIIFRTVNGGKNWKPVDFGMDGWIDAATYLDDGEAWLNVSEKGIAYTRDFGFTWSILSVPFPKAELVNIYFNNKREGIIGSAENGISYTQDNCKNWTTIPTPLDQKKYKKTDLLRPPHINRVAIFKDYLLVSQEELVFYTKRDTVNWVFMPGYTDFYTDPSNSGLFFKTSKGGFVKCNDHLQAISVYENISGPIAVCKKGSLFVLDDTKLKQIRADDRIIESPLYTDRVADIEPEPIGSMWGSIGNRIYGQKVVDGKWTYLYALPFAVDSGYLSMKDTGTILFNRNDDSLFYYSIDNAKVERRTKEEVMKSFSTKEIKKIIFSKGNSGCFSYYSNDMEYEWKGGSFVLTKKNTDDNGLFSYFKDSANEISKQTVSEFVKKFPGIYKSQATVNDLGFTQKEYDECKRDILAYKMFLESGPDEKRASEHEKEGAFYISVNNLDFNKLIALVDSVKTVDQQVLNNYLASPGLWSTSRKWVNITLVNEDNEELEIEHMSSKPTAFYFPWRITLNGVTSTTMSIEVNRFLNSVFPDFLDCKDRVAVMQGIVKELYRLQQ